jgi:hypothetical protein
MFVSRDLSRYVLKAAVRDRFLLALSALFLLIGVLSVFFGAVAVIDKTRFSLVFLASSLRFVGVLGIVLFVTAFIRRSFESHNIEYMLTRSISRTGFVFSCAYGFTRIVCILTLVQFIALLFAQGFNPDKGLMIWSLGLFCENLLLAFAAFFFAMVLSNTTLSSMACLGFYVLTHMLGQLLNYSMHSAGGFFEQYIEYALHIVSICLPRMDLVSQSAWLIYGVPQQISVWGMPLVQCLIFAGVLLCATAYDFKRKVF